MQLGGWGTPPGSDLQGCSTPAAPAEASGLQKLKKIKALSPKFHRFLLPREQPGDAAELAKAFFSFFPADVDLLTSPATSSRQDKAAEG